MTPRKAGSPATTTRAELVYHAMRKDILAGRLGPGDRLRFAELCERYGASMGVLREGLSRLVEQELVVSEPQHGFRVASLSLTDLCDVTQARVAVEALVLREAIAHGDVAWEARLVAAHHTLDRTPMTDPADPGGLNEDWTAAHAAYHAALLDGCPNARLRSMATALRDSAELYRHWSRRLGHDDPRDIPDEHRGIVEAALARDVERAVALLVGHIQHTTDILLARADELIERGQPGVTL
jgi:DNA-binding GntR family transcriptional regulator